MKMLQVKNRDYLRIAVVLGIICVGGAILSLYLYDEIVDGILRWVRNKKCKRQKTNPHITIIDFSFLANAY